MWLLQLRDHSTYLDFSEPGWAEAEAVLRRLDGYRHGIWLMNPERCIGDAICMERG